MNEFELIDHYFNFTPLTDDKVIFGIGDDAACLEIPSDMQLLVSTDTLVAEVHFLSKWDPYDIAWKAVMVNISDIAAMAAQPVWLSLALTLPQFDAYWLERFSNGLKDALKCYNITLIGGDTTRGPLCITLTIHGLAPKGKAVRRNNAKIGDSIWLSGNIGAAALALKNLDHQSVVDEDMTLLMDKLLHPKPRVDLQEVLRNYVHSAIDISDGLSADLMHICNKSNVGACLRAENIPVHPLVTKYCKNPIEFALRGGDDYELCFTLPSEVVHAFQKSINELSIDCQLIGYVEKKKGLRIMGIDGNIKEFYPKGYCHFT